MEKNTYKLMSIAIYGAGACGQYVYEMTRSKTNIVCWIDNFKNVNSFMGKPMYHESEFVNNDEFSQVKIIVAIEDDKIRQDICLSLIKKEIDEIYILDSHCFSGKLPLLNENGQFLSYIKKWRETKPVLPYLEYQVYDGCNLKCASCAHYSNVVENPSVPSVEEFAKSIRYLRKMFLNIDRIRLMGGEPLLNKQLFMFVGCARELFPYSDIRVVTNGMLLKKSPDELIEQMKKSSVLFEITYYPALDTTLPDIIDYLNQKGVDFIISPRVDRFWIRTTNGDNNPYSAFWGETCSKNCTFLRNGNLFVCPQIPLLYEQREKFGFDISEEELIGATFQLSKDRNGWEALKYLNTAKSFCRFCASKFQWKEWTGYEKNFDKQNYMVNQNGV